MKSHDPNMNPIKMWYDFTQLMKFKEKMVILIYLPQELSTLRGLIVTIISTVHHIYIVMIL